PWLNGVLAHSGHSILIGWNLQAVPVQGRCLWKMVGDGDTNMVASRDADGWSRDGAIKRPL
ncbi:MAG TPA: hypothetical protein VH593_21980, partial [Ktedonobacteraceae bacterium]